MINMKQPLVLCILDGVGMKSTEYGNAFVQANPTHFMDLWEKYPHSLLEASGEEVGLPHGQMGNSEVGHMNIGAGRIVYQPLQFIHKAIQEKTFFQNLEFLSVFDHVKKNHSSLHLVGLLSDGGIHSHIDHLFALLEMAKNEGIESVYIHPILDGRDTLPRVANRFLEELTNKINDLGIGVIATLSGRYYAMDRDNRWDRIQLAYENMTKGNQAHFSHYEKAILTNYENGKGDEFIEPCVLDQNGLVKDHDGMIVFNFRPDRLRELFSVFTNKDVNPFPHQKPEDFKLVTMMPVSEEVICTNAFQLEKLDNTFGEYISNKGLTQLRIAETEKYPHVTYFFDGGVEKELKNCDRVLIPSPKVATYDLKPEMSAYEVTEELLKRLDENKYDVVILNYANGDMVGHTGDMKATIQAIQTIDQCLNQVYEKVKSLKGTLIVIADHGNCDTMLDQNGNVVTSHSTALVPFIITNSNVTAQNGKLGDVAPTMLKVLGLEIPKEMTGTVLIQEKNLQK